MATVEELKAQVERKLETLQGQQAENKTRKEQLLEAVESDPEYVRLKQVAKDAAKAASLQKQALLNEPEYRSITASMKEAAKEIKECQATLTGALFGYTKETDKFQIETGGQLHNIQYKAKLVKTDQPTLI